jgi:hypothetical protein
MSVSKYRTHIWHAVCILAAFLAMPATASAVNNPLITYPTGTLLSVGSKIKAQNLGLQLMTVELGTLACSSFELTGTLKKNTAIEVEIEVEKAIAGGDAAGGACTAPGVFGPSMNWTFAIATNGLPWCLRSTSAMAADEVQIRGGKCTEAARPIRFIYDGGGCAYERTAPMVGTLTTHPEDAQISFAAQEFKAVEACFGIGARILFDWAFTLTKDEALGGPIYIS